MGFKSGPGSEDDVTFGGSIQVKERSADAGEVAGQGQLWVKNTTPCELYFTTDAGDDIQITSGTSMAAAGSGTNVAADNIQAGDAAVSIETTAGNITIDAQATNADVIIKVDDGGSAVTACTFDGSDEGNMILVNDIKLDSDGAVIHWGDDQEITLTHEADTGLILTHTATGDNTPVKLTLKSEEDAIIADEVIGALDFKGGDSGGTDAVLVCAGIEAVATDTHAADNNAAKLSFKTAASEAAAEKMALSSTGDLSIVTDGAAVKFGADAEVTLTHVHDTGLLLSDASGVGTTKLMFGDAACFVQQQADGELGIDADSVINVTAPTVDIDASTAVTIDGPAVTVADSAAGKPVLTLKTTHTTKTSSSELQFLKDAADTEDGEVLGQITFYGEDEGNNNTQFAGIVASISESDETDEAGKLELQVAESDGTNTAMTTGLTLEGEHATDGQIDVTIAAGAASTTTVAGLLTVTGETKVGASAGSGVDAFLYTAGAAAHVGLQWDADLNTEGTLVGGADDHGVDFKFFGETSGKYVQWDQSADALIIVGELKASGLSLSNNDSGTSNTVFGKLAGAALASGGNYNLLMGENAGNDLTTGDSNIIIGYNAAVVASTAGDLVIIGAEAGNDLAVSNTDINGTVLIGSGAGEKITAGRYNTAIGYDSLKLLVDGDSNTAVGYQALDAFDASGGGSTANTAIGASALSAANSATALYNTAVGANALMASTIGQGNTAVGTSALTAATAGTSSGYEEYTYNTALGAFAGMDITTGISNVFIGASAGKNSVLVSQCTILGAYDTEGVSPGVLTAAADGTVSLGFAAQQALTTGAGNTAVGFKALRTNVDGDYNTAVGYQALETFEAESDGEGENTAVGYHAGKAVTTGVRNTILGTFAGDGLQTGDYNVFIGASAGTATTAASSCVIVGQGAGAAVMTADANGTVAVGQAAGAAITSGIGNTAVGFNALDEEDDGDQNTAIGYKALAAQTGTTGEVGNTAVGYQAGQFATTATGTTFIGNQCGQGIGATKLTGNNNTGLGSDAGLLLQGAAHSNTYIGATAGDVTTTGVENTCLGFNADIQDATATNQVVIGNNITGTKDNAVFIGNDSSHIENDFNSDATWNHSSDVRQKTNIQDDTLGLNFVNNLRTVTYTHKSPSEFPQEWTAYDPEDTTPMGGGKTIHGFIAQEVKEALDIAGCETFGGWSVDPDGRQRVSFEAFVMPLIRAVQELSAKVEELESKLEE